MTAANPPTALVIAMSPEIGAALEHHLESLAALGVKRFVVVAPEGTKAAIERLQGSRPLQLRFVAAPETLPAAFVAAEPSLAHFAAGAVLVTQPDYAAEDRLYADLLDAWTNRPSGVEGIIATAPPHEPHDGNLRLLLNGDRLTRCLTEDEAAAEGDIREYVGALAYSWSRELCETIGEETDKHGPRDAVALGLSRLMAWNDLRNLAYKGAWRGPNASTLTPAARREPDRAQGTRLQRPYSPR